MVKNGQDIDKSIIFVKVNPNCGHFFLIFERGENEENKNICLKLFDLDLN